MAKELLVRLACDYCGEKATVAAEPRTPEQAEQIKKDTESWVQVVFSNGEVQQFCRYGCAINALKTRIESKLAP